MEYVDIPRRNGDPYLYAVKHAYANDGMCYHKKWDWIIPVVEKLKNMPPIEGNEPDYMMEGMHVNWGRVSAALITLDIEKVHEACFEYIDWINSSKSAVAAVSHEVTQVSPETFIIMLGGQTAGKMNALKNWLGLKNDE